jgi:NAD(P)-dependent dehydrogenase (short-subunit alcohol dehydrogenase family)
MPITLEKEHQGLNVERNPLTYPGHESPPSGQTQTWPGHEEKMRPRPDHGEETYQGANKLLGLKALITGGDSGIGRAVAIAFAREGADVAIAYLSEDNDARETMRYVKDAGRQGISIKGDLRDPSICADTVRRTIEAFGTINILVNNASFQWEQPDFTDITPEQLDQTFRTNIYAYFWMAQNAVKQMSAGDCIINTGSVTALTGLSSLMDYSGTKAAIHNFTRALAQQLSSRGIRVNAVAPGPVWTPLIPATRDPEATKKGGGFGGTTYWGRPAQPAELAPTYVFLASTDARYYSGEILSPTGYPATAR